MRSGNGEVNNFPRLEGSTKVASSSSSDTKMHWKKHRIRTINKSQYLNKPLFMTHPEITHNDDLLFGHCLSKP